MTRTFRLQILMAAVAMATSLAPTLHAQSDSLDQRRQEARLQALEASRAAAQSEQAERPMPTLFDLNFEGGTLGDYAEAIRQANPDANIVLLGDVAQRQIPEIQLRSVSVEAALNVIRLQETVGDQVVFRGVNRIQVAGGMEHVFQILEQPMGGRVGLPLQSQATPHMSKVWNLSEIVEHGLDAENVLGAVQTGLDLFDAESIRLRFHEPTKLLIAYGPIEQLEFIQQVISALELQFEV